MKIFRQRECIKFSRIAILFLFILSLSATSYSQSTNIDFPTPVITNEVSGVIEARDIGDPRLTRHFYLLTGTQGDLVVSVESINLNGDVDLFTAGSLRPLAKLNIFSGLSTTSTTKSVFLRRRETLILRIEARSMSDDPGTYRVRFSGGFEPVAAALEATDESDPTVSESRSGNKKVRRVNSAGARVNEALPEIAASTDPTEGVPPATVEAEREETRTEPTTPEPDKPAPVKPATPKPVRSTRARPPTRSSRRKPATVAKKKEDVPAPTPTPATPTAPVEPVLNPRLIIETRDGVRVERHMSEVRSVTVTRGQLIVVTSDGKVERRPMSSVLRVAIEP